MATGAATRSEEELLRYRLGTLGKAVQDLGQTYGDVYPKASEFMERTHRLRQRLLTASKAEAWETTKLRADFTALQQDALLAHPLLKSNHLLLVKRRPGQYNAARPGYEIGMPPNHECDSSLERIGYNNELCTLSPVGPQGLLRTLYRPAKGGYLGETDLHWDAERLLFTQSDATNWKVFELRTDGSGLRQVSVMPDDVDSLLPAERQDRLRGHCFVSVGTLPSRAAEGQQPIPDEF